MGLSLSKIAGSVIPGVGPYLAGKDAKEAAKEQKKAAQEGARFKHEQTTLQAEFEERTSRERVETELGATLRSAALERQQAQEQAGIAVAALDQKIGADQAMSTLRQNEQARKSRANLSAMRAGGIESGIALSGTAADVVQQSATFARLEQLTSAYESEVGVRGMQFDRAALMLRSRQANEAYDFTVGTARESADLSLRQGRESLELTRKLADEAKTLELKYAAVNYRTERNRIDTQTAVNIAGEILNRGNQAADIYLRATRPTVAG